MESLAIVRSLWRPVALSLAVGCASLLIYFLVQLQKARVFFKELQRKGMPMPKHSYLFGHLLSLKPVMDALPSDAHKVYTFGNLARQFQQNVYYLDLWPVSVPFMIINSPELANQVCQTTKIAYDKPDALIEWFRPIAGGPSLFDTDRHHWKPLRALFSPAFSTNHILTLVPSMVECTLEYCATLRQRALSNDMFLLDPVTLRFVMDLMGKLILNAHFGAQRGRNELVDAMLSQIQWKISNKEVNPLELINLPRNLMEWYNGKKMDRYIGQELDKRFQAYQAGRAKANPKGERSIIDLAIQDYMESSASGHPPETLDPQFRVSLTRNIRMFLFAGHDSTSSTICYCYHLLATNPHVLARVLEEHNAVLGADASAAASVISQDPHVLNKLTYTHAAIKETTRLFPAASSIRQGSPDVELVDGQGNRYPTAGLSVWVLHHEMQRSDKFWPRPLEFLPERWLVGPEDELYPPKGVWRTFEMGPRNCIGQPLVFVEIKTILALTIRQFDIQPAYNEWDRLHPRKGLMDIEGERVYQREEGAAHPADKYPCRVALRM